MMVVCYNSSREHENSSRQGERGQGWGMSTRVNEVVAAAWGSCFDVSSSVGCKKKEAHFCKQGMGQEQLKASL